MIEHFFDKFKLSNEKEAYETVLKNIENNIIFRGTNLWVLIFAIFVASLGLNVNSPAVIIGAMLISPLMGPIMGIGLGVTITDVNLLRRASYNYIIAIIVSLTTSTIFFLLSPLNDAHSEILARTSPNIYDVLIALFGGFAGILATYSKQKGNVIQGVAIATALMPPLCTAGYGIATLQFKFFLGAFYLFIINTVFIALATFITLRVMNFPRKDIGDEKTEKLSRRVICIVVLLTLLPSIYFGYNIVQQKKFSDNANRFIINEAHFPNNYLLNKKIDAKTKHITLIFGGKEISAQEVDQLKEQLKKYDLHASMLEVRQGFSYLSLDNNNEQVNSLSAILQEKEKNSTALQVRIDSLTNQQNIGNQIYKELKTQYPALNNAIIQPSLLYSDTTIIKSYLALLYFSKRVPVSEKNKITNWLKIRLNENNIKLVFQ